MHLKAPTHMMTDRERLDFRLTRQERESQLWKRLSAWLEAERQHVRESNDSVTLGIAETTAKRGEIRFASRILALADEAGQEARQSDEAMSPTESAISRLTADSNLE